MEQVAARDTSSQSQQWPRWASDLDRSLAIRSQFVLSGNIRDVHLTPTDDGLVLLPIVRCLWELLRNRAYGFLLVYDRVDGLRVYPDSREKQALAGQLPGVSLPDGRREASLQALPQYLRAVACAQGIRAAFVVDYASRLATRPQDLSEGDLEFFVACEKLSHAANRTIPAGAAGAPLFNPIIWLVNRQNDLPDWFVVGNEAVGTQVVPLPDFEARRTTAELLAPSFHDCQDHELSRQQALVDTFADLAEGLSLQSMIAVTQLAFDQGIPFANIADAVRCFKVGVPDNPWRKEHIKARIRTAEASISERVKGQHQAVRKTLDILTRSVMGLTGAQASSSGSRPRGVLFFAGPTGVGKTELAKAVTKLIFGDERAYIRFDMSEFSAEHSDARLIGAPPGYVGYDAGGELVNAVRQRPFSVILFDEIEKAHPRILDKFLQILEDGRLTDGRGDTVHFSEAIIVFTSNLGIYVEDDHGRRVLNVTPEHPHEEVEQKVRRAIEDYFRFRLERPELLNRIGDNIVVFDFIRPPVAREIFEKMLNAIVGRVRDEHGLALEVPEGVRGTLLEWCAADLSNGGRGIGNRLETTFINPLARALFDMELENAPSLRVDAVTTDQNTYSVELS